MVNILILEKNNEMAFFLSKKLDQAGYSSDISSDIQQALPLVASGKYGLILLDLGLGDPGILRDWTHVPIIALSSSVHHVTCDEALLMGANECITQPFYFNHLLTYIRAYTH